MRLLIVGTLEGHISAARKIAMARGAKVEQVDTIDAALAALRGGQGADLVMVDVNLNVKSMMESLKSERINAPVVTCGIGNETDAAVEAIQAGAKEYVPLPPDPELIAAILEAATEETSAIIHGSGPMEKMIALADHPTARSFGTMTPHTPAASATRRQLPRLRGSCTPSSTSTSLRDDPSRSPNQSSKSTGLAARLRTIMPWCGSPEASRSSVARSTRCTVTPALSRPSRSASISRFFAAESDQASSTASGRCCNRWRTGCKPQVK